jgi:hypothetical protein
MRVLAGRDFEWSDGERSRRVAVITETLAQRLFPARDAVGRNIDVDKQKNVEIVGVVDDAGRWSIRARDRLAVFTPLLQEPASGQPMVGLRLAGDPASFRNPLRAAIESLGYHRALRMETLGQRSDSALAEERIMSMLSVFCGALALLISLLGIYGITSYSVVRRTSEIGVRMAIGARSRDVIAVVLGDTARLVLAGLAAGIPLALAASRGLATVLYGVSAQDPVILTAAVLTLAVAAAAAACIPALRAARMYPMSALRHN